MSVYDRVDVTIQSTIFQPLQVVVPLQSGTSGDVRSNDDVRVQCRSLKLFRLLVCDVHTFVVNYMYIRYIVSVVRNEFKERTRFGHKLFRAPVWVLYKLSPDIVQTEFSGRTTSCIVYDVVIAQRYSLVCTYALDESCFLLWSRASDEVSRRLHLNLHKSVHLRCKKRPPSLVA